MRHARLGLWAALMWSSMSLAEEGQHQYSGLQARDIATLSAEDIQDLEAGRGWGLALAAELNGYPGPRHVLEHAEDLALSAAQAAQIENIFARMRADAIAGGAALIAAEKALNQAFAGRTVTPATLEDLVDRAASARGDLRLIHLSRHLETMRILSDHQIARYSVLRGYTSDPCSAVPEGHNEAMWRRHNGCEN